jgi:hypothetical protein
MFNDKKGPIEHFSWGKYIISGEEHSKTSEGKKGKGKDIRLVNGKVKKWKEREGHTLTPGMLKKVYDEDIDTLIIGIGVHGQVECPSDVKKKVKKNGIENLLLLETPEACRKYNELYHKGEKVALLAHGTC